MDNSLTEKEIEEFTNNYKDTFNWSLIARSGNGNRTDETYCYIYIDDLGINITIDPVDGGFRFCKIIDRSIFKIDSTKFTGLFYEDYFITNYIKFRNLVIEKQL